jgi:hypothetical protein
LLDQILDFNSCYNIGKIDQTDRVAQEILSFCWDMLHFGDWKNVDNIWRYIYSCTSFVQAIIFASKVRNQILNSYSQGKFAEAVKKLDTSLIIGMGAPSDPLTKVRIIKYLIPIATGNQLVDPNILRVVFRK